MPVKKVKTQNAKVKIKVQKPKVETKKDKVAKKVQEKKTESKPATRGLTVDVYDVKGKAVEKMTLPKEVFGAKINNALMAQAVRVYLANQRSGTASTKTRGEVSGSTRKIYRQKGTGRARHGAKKAPIFVHGGIAFGPKPRDYSLKLSQKMKKAALVSALSTKCKNGEIKVLSGLLKIEPKTKLMAQILKNLELDSKKTLLVMPEKSENVQRAGRNLENLYMILVDNLNTYEVLDNKTLILMKESVEKIIKSTKEI